MLKINIHEAKTQLSRYAKRVKAGETILLCDRNTPFAEIRPLSPMQVGANERPLGNDREKLIFAKDWDSVETNRQVATMFGIDE